MAGLRSWWSWGEATKPETINYRSFKPEKDGLFCERIFGPVKDWECHCGKKAWHPWYRGVICDRCGVEVTLSKVRRDRIRLHRARRSRRAYLVLQDSFRVRWGNLLDLTLRDLEKVDLLFPNYVVIEPGEQEVHTNELLDEEQYLTLRAKAKGTRATPPSSPTSARRAVRDLLRRLDVDKIADELCAQVDRRDEASTRRSSSSSRLKIVDAFRNSGDNGDVRNKPEWMIPTSSR